MVLLLFFAVLVFVVVWLVGPSRLVRWMRQYREQAPAPTVSLPVPSVPDPADPPPTDEELLEQILTTERLAGILSPEDYQEAMAAIAEQDAASRPLAVPPEPI
jgi:hypothetical protein